MLFSLFFIVIFFNKKVVIVIAVGEKGGHHKKVIVSSKLNNYAPVFLLFFGNIFLFPPIFSGEKILFSIFFAHLCAGHPGYTRPRYIELTLYHASFLHAPSQWEMMLHCNVVSHWLGAYTEWSQIYASPGLSEPMIFFYWIEDSVVLELELQQRVFSISRFKVFISQICFSDHLDWLF